MRAYLCMVVFIGICLTHAITAAQSSSAVENSAKLVEIQIEFCEAKLQKPPLERLYFRVSLHNLTGQPQWVLLPSVLYSAPTQAPSGAGISEIDLLENQSRTIKFLRFSGSLRVTRGLPNDGGGFQGLLLGPRTEVTLPVTIDYWGRLDAPLPITGEIAHRIEVRGKSIAHYFHTPLANPSRATAGHLSVVDSWKAPNQTEVVVTVESIGQFSIPDALAARCKSEGQ
jgi:hypothetical protein